jgi:hypothetical protein
VPRAGLRESGGARAPAVPGPWRRQPRVALAAASAVQHTAAWRAWPRGPLCCTRTCAAGLVPAGCRIRAPPARPGPLQRNRLCLRLCLGRGPRLRRDPSWPVVCVCFEALGFGIARYPSGPSARRPGPARNFGLHTWRGSARQSPRARLSPGCLSGYRAPHPRAGRPDWFWAARLGPRSPLRVGLVTVGLDGLPPRRRLPAIVLLLVDGLPAASLRPRCI